MLPAGRSLVGNCEDSPTGLLVPWPHRCDVFRFWIGNASVDSKSLSLRPRTIPTLASRLPPTRGCPSYGFGEAPTLPVRSTTWLSTQSRAGDLDLEQLAGMSNHEVTDPLGKRRAAAHHDMLSPQRLLDCSPLRIRKANENPSSARMGCRRPSKLCHRVTDITISQSRMMTPLSSPPRLWKTLPPAPTEIAFPLALPGNSGAFSTVSTKEDPFLKPLSPGPILFRNLFDPGSPPS
jgi:hypothetical protein